MPLFRKLPGGPRDLAVSMVGVKLGDRLLQIGCGSGATLAALAAKVGLTGRACAVDATAPGAAKGRQAAERAGVLIEIAEAPYRALPYEADALDIVVLHDVLATMSDADRASSLQEVRRVLRGGGRVVVIDQTGGRGFAGLFGRPSTDPGYARPDSADTALRDAGFIAVRTLTEREHLRFAEGVKPRNREFENVRM